MSRTVETGARESFAGFSAARALCLAGAFFILPALWAAGCDRGIRHETPPAGESAREVPDQVFEGFEMTMTEEGVKKGWVEADRAEKYADRQLFRVYELTVLFYDDNGTVTSVLTSDRGIIHTAAGDMEAIDSVVVFSADSSKVLRTDHLVWRKQENRIYGDSTVTITSPLGTVHGTGIEADGGFANIELDNPTGDINVLGEDF